MEKALFNDLVEGLTEMVEIETGKKPFPAERSYTHKIPDVKAIRKKTTLKQNEFAEALGVSVAAVQSWETARRIPNGAARKLLLILEHQPQLVSELRVL